jgi:AcrR family transcriptional regulator
VQRSLYNAYGDTEDLFLVAFDRYAERLAWPRPQNTPLPE